MKVTVKLYGTLSAGISGYHHDRGIDLDLPEGASINDLLTSLDIAHAKRPVVAIDGRIQKSNDRIPSGAQIKVFQPVHGG
jgi:sulfur carrier protein ThiS